MLRRLCAGGIGRKGGWTRIRGALFLFFFRYILCPLDDGGEVGPATSVVGRGISLIFAVYAASVMVGRSFLEASPTPYGVGVVRCRGRRYNLAVSYLFTSYCPYLKHGDAEQILLGAVSVLFPSFFYTCSSPFLFHPHVLY
jgi:hypothetical protein